MPTLHVFSTITPDEQKVIFAEAGSVGDAKNELSLGGKGGADYTHIGSFDESAEDSDNNMSKLILGDQNRANIAVFQQI